jgi:hypothetical protein
MKQLTVDVLTCGLVLLNSFTNILGFVPEFSFPNFIVALIPLPIPTLFLAIGLMVVGVVLDVAMQRSRMGSIAVIGVFGFAFWALTPNILLVAVFVGAIAFGQFVLKE